MNRHDWAAVAYAVTFLLVVIAGLVIWTTAPCDLWYWSSTGNMPARCLP